MSGQGKDRVRMQGSGWRGREGQDRRIKEKGDGIDRRTVSGHEGHRVRRVGNEKRDQRKAGKGGTGTERGT